jgi:type IV conjugative transfer system coupling protein TraD
MTQKTILKNFVRGGQIILHELHMLGQVANEVIIASLAFFILLNAGWFYIETAPYHRYLTQSWLEAQGLLFFDNNAKQNVVLPNGKTQRVYSQQVVRSPQINKVVQKVEKETTKRLIATAIFYPIMLLLISNWLRKRGKSQGADNFIRGSKVASSEEVTELLVEDGNASEVKVGNVPIVKNSERSHFFIHGTTGTGKTQSFGHLIDHIRAQGQRAIVYDKGGIFIQSFYNPETDIILNPLDDRSVPWNLWGECKDQADYDSLTEAFIPTPPHTSDPFWTEAARTVFSSAAYKMSLKEKPTMPELLKALLRSNLYEIEQLLQGTGAEALVSDKIEKTALCIRASVATAVKSLQYITSKDAYFAVRDWVLDEKKYKGFLFISSVADKHATLRPLISMWLDTAVKTILSLSEDERRRVWILLDELPTLNKLPCLQNTLALGRKYGTCAVIGIQNYAMLQSIYGNSGAESLKDLCNTSLFFRSPSRKMSDWAANELGESEFEQVQEGVSYGANTIRDGVSVNNQRVKRNIIISSEIMTLNNLEAFLKLSGNYPVCKINIDYIKRDNNNQTFVPVSLSKEEQQKQKEAADLLTQATQAAPLEIKAVLRSMTYMDEIENRTQEL